MDYIRLVDITNQYPNLPSYVRQNEKLVNLFGLYKETNKLEFKMPSIEHIKPVDDLSLRLIFGFRKNVEDKNIQYFTSQQFYSDMEASNIEGNPYFYLQSNKVEFIVLVNLEKFISTFEKLKEIENKQGIDVKINNFIRQDSSVNYEKLMRYLDWVLSKPSLDEIDTDGVIPADKLAEWEVGDYDPIMMKWSFNKDKDAKAKENTQPPPVSKSTIENWRLVRKRNLDRNGMGIYPTPNVKNFNSGTKNKADKRTGIIKEGQTFTGYKYKTLDNGFVIWALQGTNDSAPTGYAYQGKGDTVERV